MKKKLALIGMVAGILTIVLGILAAVGVIGGSGSNEEIDFYEE